MIFYGLVAEFWWGLIYSGRMLKVLGLGLFFSLGGCVHSQAPKPLPALPEGKLSVVVRVDGIRCCEGVLRLAVYNEARSWMSDTNIVRGRLGFVQSESQTLEVHGLPTGSYAVAVYQDVNSDNRLNRWFGLIPKEPYGFSNNVGRYGPASFEKAAFDLTEDKSITIKLNSR